MTEPVVLAGWAGTALYVAAHGWAGARDDARRPAYFLVNAVAGILACAVSVHFGTPAAVALHGFWAVVSGLALAGANTPVAGTVRALALPPRLLVPAIVAIAMPALFFAGTGATQRAADWLGWSGTAAFCGAYLAFSAHHIGRRGYLAFMLYAPLALLPVLVLDRNWPVVALESAWAAISATGLVLTTRRR